MQNNSAYSHPDDFSRDQFVPDVPEGWHSDSWIKVDELGTHFIVRARNRSTGHAISVQGKKYELVANILRAVIRANGLSAMIG